MTNLSIAVSAPPFRLTSVVRQGQDVGLTWTTRGGESYRVQAATQVNGSLSNAFTDISPLIAAPPTAVSATNYSEPGVLSNASVRWYRIRLGP